MLVDDAVTYIHSRTASGSFRDGVIHKHDVCDSKDDVSDAKHDVSDVKHDVSDTKHDVSDAKHHVCNVEHHVSDAKRYDLTNNFMHFCTHGALHGY